MRDEMRRQSEDVTRVYDDIDRRVAETGMDGIVGLLTLSRHVEAALDAVGAVELEATVVELRSLLDRLVRIDAELSRVRALKLELADDDETV